MSFTRGFRTHRRGRHFTERHTGTVHSVHETDYPLVLNRASLLAAAMVGATIFEVLIMVLVKGLFPELHEQTHDVARSIMLGALVFSVVALIVTRIPSIPFKGRFAVGVTYVLSMVIVISAAEVATQWWRHGPLYSGMPWVCVWLLLVPIVVPIRWQKTVGRGITLSLLPVLTMYLGIRWFDLPPAPVDAYVAFFLPCAIVTALALIIARMMYTLTQEVQQAKQLGSYELVEQIGAGGMGEVWRAKHRMLVRPAAVKLIRPESLHSGPGADQAIAERFQREAQATAVLRSPHTVELYDFGLADDGTFFYVMELLAGLDLKDMVDRFGPLPAERVIALMQQMCCSLGDAHDVGLLHRDVKPANIFVCKVGQQRDFVKVLDFGLVKSLHPKKQDIDLTAPAAALGTPSVMAPETINGRPADHRVDLYGLGCVAYWLLTGSQVFEAESTLALAAAHAKDEPAPPSSCSELEIPPELDRIVLDLLAKNPDDRPASAAELASRLAAVPVTNPWTQQRAVEWWEMHLPDVGVYRCTEV